MKKLSIAFLLLIILTSFLMTSCNNTADDTSPNAVRVERPVEETAFSAREAEDDGLPEMNYDGAEFHILARDRDDFKEEIGVELKQSEEVVSNAIFNRNKEVEERFGVKLVFVTCGAEGCFFKNAQAQGHVPSLSGIKVIDTTGAGDIFGGSALWKLLQTGMAPEELNEAELRDIVTFACTAAGLSTTKSGGISSVPDYEAVLQYLQ